MAAANPWICWRAAIGRPCGAITSGPCSAAIATRWARPTGSPAGELNDGDRAWFRRLPVSQDIGHGILAFHGTPDDDNVYLVEEIRDGSSCAIRPREYGVGWVTWPRGWCCAGIATSRI